jgi:hypothetical protein
MDSVLSEVLDQAIAYLDAGWSGEATLPQFPALAAQLGPLLDVCAVLQQLGQPPEPVPDTTALTPAWHMVLVLQRPTPPP